METQLRILMLNQNSTSFNKYTDVQTTNDADDDDVDNK